MQLNNNKNSLREGEIYKKSAIEICKFFSVATFVNHNLITDSQMIGLKLYNKQLAIIQKKLLNSKSEDDRYAIFDMLEKIVKNMSSIFTLIESNSSIKSIFDYRTNLLNNNNHIDFLEIKFQENKEYFLNNQVIHSNDYVEKFNLMLEDVINDRLESKFSKELQSVWDLGYNSLEIDEPCSISILNSSLLSIVDVVEELGGQAKIAGLNGLVGLKLENNKNKRVVAEFIPLISQIIIQKWDSENVPYNLKSTLIHEWTHAIDVISMKQAYPEYYTTVSGQSTADTQTIYLGDTNEIISNNDFIPLVKSLEDMILSMYSKNPHVEKNKLLNKESDIVDNFYKKALGNEWSNLSIEQKEQLHSFYAKDILLKWIASKKSEIIRGSFIDIIIPILGNETSFKISQKIKTENFTDLEVKINNTYCIKKDSEYYNHTSKNHLWDIRKMKLRALFNGDNLELDKIKQLEEVVKGVKCSTYYFTPEEMLARQMETSFFPQEVAIQKLKDQEARFVYPETENLLFKEKTIQMIGFLEKACGMKPQSASEIFNSINNIKNNLNEKNNILTKNIKYLNCKI